MKTRPLNSSSSTLQTPRAAEAGQRRQQLRVAPAEVAARGDRRQHARHAEVLGGDVGGVRRQQGDDGLELEVLHAAVDLRDQPADDEPDRDAARRDEREAAGRVREREAAGRDGREREAVGDQAGRVVDQALALEDGDDPARDLEALR